MEIIWIVSFAFLASMVGTMTSFGTATFMVPVLGLFYPLSVTLLFTGVIHWFGNVWKMFFFRSGKQWPLILLFGLPGIVASYLGAKLLPSLPEEILLRLLGGFFITYVVFLLINENWKVRASKSSAILGGVLSGFSAGVFGVGGAIRAAFLSAYDLKKEIFIFTAGAIGLFIDSGRLVKYILDGVRFEKSLWIALALAIPVSFLGAFVGKKIVNKIPQRGFRTVIAVALFAMGAKYLLYP